MKPPGHRDGSLTKKGRRESLPKSFKTNSLFSLNKTNFLYYAKRDPILRILKVKYGSTVFTKYKVFNIFFKCWPVGHIRCTPVYVCVCLCVCTTVDFWPIYVSFKMYTQVVCLHFKDVDYESLLQIGVWVLRIFLRNMCWYAYYVNIFNNNCDKNVNKLY